MKHIFLANRAFIDRKRSKEDVEQHLGKMRKSIIRMSLTYTDLDRLKEKIEKFMEAEARYAKFFKAEDPETKELKSRIALLEQELKSGNEEKMKIISENNEKISQLNATLENIKSQMKILHMDKAKRHQRFTALDRKIKERIDMHHYYSS